MTLSDVARVVVPRTCIEQVQRHMRAVGQDGHEGLGLWVGKQDGARFTVLEAIIPAQRHVRTADGVCVVVGPDELHRINKWLFEHRLTLVAQIHSHPGRAYHSGTDDDFAVATRVGCLSLVVPDYATGRFELATTATFRLDASGRWRGIRTPEVRRLIEIVE
ncbi:Mov34/MPN/PAD-1 family protein [Methylobacterium sp. WL116]|uniref:Mov34/MPN/PAD-1 family protein n=1 Tax=Methylobacterium sp. WL116 TaxID=2603889 RepID=UPI0011C8E59B|nr:Mov34/MPN/PAD-1 family protein [Methylobacterium sp. WL116]TXM95588.1 hypothetical protein FV223_00550 [Methylobacterium sp. WL116]